eukprot:NODE_10175_length_535_cov_23.750000_g9528_i0.p1 GENE.NODE_10175_length_535_cov_23.750000_g9528_i0~~NODE_10175_length_535_cov_23.750000_g9528_i0.p1  ORF type:complete len:161 (-),score=21.95 NODE_10175_length_535_cov_23.750000_g9528_i0:53-478(-)
MFVFHRLLLSISVKHIRLPKGGKYLNVTFSNGEEAALSSEWLRVNSPSADAHQTGPHSNDIQPIFGKSTVLINGIEQTGRYAVRLVFSDKHDTGIYSWDLLYDLHKNKIAKMKEYLLSLRKFNLSRRPRKMRTSLRTEHTP